MPKDRFITEFEQKWSYEKFLDTRRRAEKIRINLADEKKAINKWITEYEEIQKLKAPRDADQASEGAKDKDLVKPKAAEDGDQIMQDAAIPENKAKEKATLYTFPY